MKQIILFLSFFALTTALFAQKNTKRAKRETSILVPISDSLLKTEMSYFTVNSSALKIPGKEVSEVLTEIPLISCDENQVHLAMSTFFSSVSTFIHIYFKEENSKRFLDSILLVTHSHYHVAIPDSAYIGIEQKNFCDVKNVKKAEYVYSPFYKAFYSLDRRRLYIYMQGEVNSEKCEITWVFVNDKFYKHVLERI